MMLKTGTHGIDCDFCCAQCQAVIDALKARKVLTDIEFLRVKQEHEEAITAAVMEEAAKIEQLGCYCYLLTKEDNKCIGLTYCPISIAAAIRARQGGG
jgi:hypothetical protein